MSQEIIWETFNSLFVTVHRQGKRVEELEQRVADLEVKLSQRAAPVADLFKNGEVRAVPPALGFYDLDRNEAVIDDAQKDRIVIISGGAARPNIEADDASERKVEPCPSTTEKTSQNSE
jgi:hypothetical protein